MSATMRSETIQFTIQAKITFSGLSDLSGDEIHILRANFHGPWTIQAHIPKAPLTDEQTGLGLFIFAPPGSAKQGIGRGDGIKVTLSVESLKGEEQASFSFRWNVKTSLRGNGPSRIIDWNEFWHKNADHRCDDGFCVIVNITSVTSIRPMVREPFMLCTISELTKGNNVYDTQFLLFSQPRLHGHALGAQDPLPVYASAAFLRSQCEYFNTMFSDSTYSESKLLPFDTTPDAEWIEKYEYDSDSDLGHFSNDSDEHSETSSTSSESLTSGSDDPLLPITDETADQSTLDLPQVSQQMADIKPDVDIGVLHQNRKASPICRSERVGKVVCVKDTAYITWRAMIFYLLTSQISFAPLSSSLRSRARSVRERIEGMPPKPSAKSMYRLADKLGLDDLCKLSLSHIQSQLSTDIIFQELFSGFTSRYKTIRDMELAFLFDHWEELKSSQQLDDIIKEVTRGDLPHASDVLKAILTR